MKTTNNKTYTYIYGNTWTASMVSRSLRMMEGENSFHVFPCRIVKVKDKTIAKENQQRHG